MPQTAEELALLRADLETWLTDTCDIFRVTGADDVYGGHTRDHGASATYTGVPCTLESGAAQDQERLLAGAIAEIQVFTVTVPAETDIRVGDHLVVHSEDDIHLKVHAVMAPETLEIERRVIAVETDPLQVNHG